MKKYKEIVETNREIIKCSIFSLKFLWKEKKDFFFFWAMTIVISTLGPFVDIIGSKYIINEIAYKENRNINNIIFWIAFIAIGNCLYGILRKIASERQYYCNDQFTRKFQTDLSKRTIKMKFANTENPEVLEKIKKASRGLNETDGVVAIMGTISGIIYSVMILCGVTYLVFTCSYLLIIPVILSVVVSSIISGKVNNVRKDVFDRISDKYRVWDYYSNSVNDSRYAKDVRIYNAKEMLLKKNIDSGMDIVHAIKDYDDKMWGMDRFRTVIAQFCDISVYVIIGIEALMRRITLGDFSSLIQATLQFSTAINEIVECVFDLNYTAHLFVQYIEFIEDIDYKELEEKDTAREVPADTSSNLEIEFKKVSFKYPNTEMYVLKNVNAKIKNGEHLSIVGENGAGKTTFIKLLCRLYEVTEGEILINGVNINEYEYSEYVKLLSVVFQDYRLLAFSIKDNICLGEENVKDEKIMELCKLGGMSEWVESTEKGLDTIMYKQFDETGVEPSGGQAQKLAIVRALYKDAPMVILDEPTAALDPISEYEIYKHFDSLVGGKTAVYISHRLSSCRFCDRIIVFNNGTIIENGTHDELVKIKNGFYANMYNTQAKHYLV